MQVPPPHLSPFVNNEEEGYTPEWAKQVKQLQVRAEATPVCMASITRMTTLWHA
jgi:hypothetical protein